MLRNLHTYFISKFNLSHSKNYNIHTSSSLVDFLDLLHIIFIIERELVLKFETRITGQLRVYGYNVQLRKPILLHY
jgi:hypothetical protein